MALKHRIAVLVRDGLLPMELGLVHQLFRAARNERADPLYEVVTCTLRPGAVRTDADFAITVDAGADLVAAADTVIIPASHEQDETPGHGLDEDVAGVLADLRPSTRVASICTGGFLLAATGRLDGLRATTHWKSAELFRESFPRVELVPDVLYTDNGGTVLTSAGEASGIDLCLYMIQSDHGMATANAVARANVVPPHRDGGQAQYIRWPVAEPRRSSTGRARAYVLAHLDRPLGLAELAACESTSVRTFTRRFRDETGVSPGRWIARQRLDRARELLEETDHSIDRIAAETGFGTATSLRQHLRATLGVSPSAYRRTFRGTAA